MADFDKLKKLCQLIRYDILTSTTEAGSGHPTTSLSAVELMTTLFFAGFLRSDLGHPKGIFNDRVVFSKGHASPLIYSLYHAAGAISYPELMRLRKFSSDLEGHPTFRFKYADIATGSLGQGLSAGVGMALGIKLRIKNEELRIDREPKVWVLLGDSEMAEGQVWEAIQIASHYKLNNLIAIADINRLGQSTQTMLGWDLITYKKRFEAFGWRTIIVDDGHDIKQVYDAFIRTDPVKQGQSLKKPTMILARTIKGKGVSFLENKEGLHGKPVSKDLLDSALQELGQVDLKVRGKIEKSKIQNSELRIKNERKLQTTNYNLQPQYELGSSIATRMAYGDALLALGGVNDKIVALDAEMSNSTYSEKFAKKFPSRYFEMFIAEQNMVTTALGMSKLGFIPFISTFAAFLTRGFDQIRMAQYSAPNLKIVGSHCGVSIGPDGPSQMGLEDLAMFRSILNSAIFYPADATSTFKLTQIMTHQDGLFYLRTNRKETPVIYDEKEEFKIGGSKIHKIVGVGHDRPVKVLIIAAGVTLHEALKAQKELARQGIETVVLDCYSVKPIDVQSINRLVMQTKNVIVVEDHYPTGGLGEAVRSSLNNETMKQCNNFIHLCVRKLPRSGTPEELLRFEEIDVEAIIKVVKKC
ncbi:MAG: Transketolase [Candidatus Gottesmanbacteria bacterium GW2011_GWA2_44_17]|uniref:Transketolase n=1 Tax=Candidatus Gottesmanbacteria bacterium GW2011_GWA2_44_17 TaxID=1618444 RepID=A0A0G1HM65_9BACT|nr:MAG: Transketolase [Candidatus Gottesmanbacteria bacterium GW2011_GWA2_44_17]